MMFACLFPFNVFFPLEAESRNIDTFTIGLIISTYSVSYLCTSLITVAVLDRLGRKRVAVYSTYLVVVSAVALGSLPFYSNITQFLLVAFLFRALLGFSVCLYMAAAMAGISFLYRDKFDKAIGILKAHIGKPSLLSNLLLSM